MNVDLVFFKVSFVVSRKNTKPNNIEIGLEIFRPLDIYLHFE